MNRIFPINNYIKVEDMNLEKQYKQAYVDIVHADLFPQKPSKDQRLHAKHEVLRPDCL